MRITALASALILLGASVTLAHATNINLGTIGGLGAAQAAGAGAGGAGTGGTGGSTGLGGGTGGGGGGGGAIGAAARATSGSGGTGSSTTNPLEGATAGTPSVSQPVPQTPYVPPVVTISLADGLTVPEFGTSLFSGSFAGTRPADRPDYLIQPGDVIVVNLYGAVNSGGLQTVDVGGDIFILGVGPVKVGGVPASQLQATVSAAVGKVFTGAVSVYATISNAGTIGVYVSGDVFRPGRYAGGTRDSVLFYLNQAQGITQNGTYRAVTIRRNGQVVATYDLYDFLLKGDAQPFRFQDGDVIFVGPRGELVGASGQLANAAAFEAPPHASMTGADLIRMARPEPTMTGVNVTGYRNGTPRQAFFTVEDFARVVLAEGDHVTFSTSGVLQTITVSIQGDVTGPKVFVMQRGTELSQLLAKLPIDSNIIEPRWVHVQRPSVAAQQKAAMTDELNRLQKQVLTATPSTNNSVALVTAQATMITQFVQQAQTITPNGNIAVYSHGQFTDLRLEDGDAVILPTRSDVVLVTGEVESPNGLAHIQGMDIEGYVNRSGGYATHANKKKFVILHQDGSGEVAGSHDKPLPGDEILVLPNVGNTNLQLFLDMTTLLFQFALSAATVISVSKNL
jgi:protein involved in polysaccharide export with SLBB domain